MKGFSCSHVKYVEDEALEYGILFGNEKIVFIKVGAGGSVQGHENKYLKMARRIHRRMGATVICASNPAAPHEELDEAEIRRVIVEQGLSNYEIFFLGTSDGAHHNLSLAKRFPQTAKWIGINTSYITAMRLKERLAALPTVEKVMIYGTEDEGFHDVVPTLSPMEDDNFKLKFVRGADHTFTGMTEEFIALADCLVDSVDRRGIMIQ